jgi:hypothetical protein
VKVDDSNANVRSCVCPDCPSYDSCAAASGETLYCARGMSACDFTRNGCICGECSVWKTYALAAYYFCIEGAAT